MEKREFLLGLFREFGDNAQKALDFIRRNEGTADTNQQQPLIDFKDFDDGVYLIYKDGSCMRFDADCPKEGVDHVGVIFSGHKFGVALEDIPEPMQLIREDVKCEEESRFYRDRECVALQDWGGMANTEHIRQAGTDIELEDGYYIPALAVLVAICCLTTEGTLNEALEHAGGKPLDMNSWYWSSTEYSQYDAWPLGFSDGSVYIYDKKYSNRVRPVCAF